MRSFIGEDSEYVLLDVHGGRKDGSRSASIRVDIDFSFRVHFPFPNRSVPIWNRAEMTI